MNSDAPQFESPEQMADATAAGLVQVAAHNAFQLFWNKEFRRLASFDVISQIEQDRIFNELVVSYVVLLLLLLEAPDLRDCPREFRDYLLDLKERIPNAHTDYLRSLGVKLVGSCFLFLFLLGSDLCNHCKLQGNSLKRAYFFP